MILVADSVSKRFASRAVLTSATLRATPGTIRVLLGRNGSGKSTLMRIAAGMTQPDSGSLFLGGHALTDASHASLALRGVSYLPADGLFSHSWSVHKQLTMVSRRFAGLSVATAVSYVGVSVNLDRRPSALSGGELRRAELAALLLSRADCVLADEPFRGLSPLDAEAIARVFRSLAEDGTAIVITGHDPALLLRLADQVTLCHAGTTYELGPPGDAARSELLRREYLGVSRL